MNKLLLLVYAHLCWHSYNKIGDLFFQNNGGKKRKIVSFLILFSLFPIESYSQYLFDSLFYGEYQRSYVLHLPKDYPGVNKLPMVLAFHGGGGAGWQSIAAQSTLTKKADSSGFILVYPEGVPINGYRGWNAGGCCPFSTTYNIDDVGFINAMLDTLIRKYSVDTKRIYATGSSNGGIFCFRLAMELSHRIAAIAPNAATSMFTAGKPQRAVPMINFHSFQDLNVPYDRGKGTGDFKGYFPSQDSTLSFWAKNNKCRSADTVYKSKDFIQINYSGCDCNADIIHYATYDGGHSWPGGPPIQGKDSPSKYISATNLLWEFFKKFTLDCNPTRIIDEYEKMSAFLMYPNPAQHILAISNLPPDFSGVVTIINPMGQVIYSGRKAGTQFYMHTRNLNSGVYILQLISDQRQLIVRKFIKQ